MKYTKALYDQIIENNPVLKRSLGICSALAVTNLMVNAFVMSLGVIFVSALSGLTVSLIRKYTDRHIRILFQMMVIASYVILVDICLKFYVPEISKALGPYVGLIITNCIIMGRCESFAQLNPPAISFVDGIAAGLGYSAVLMVIAFFRELLGFGSLFGIHVLGDWWRNWGTMSIPAGAFFMIGILVWIATDYNMHHTGRRVVK